MLPSTEALDFERIIVTTNSLDTQIASIQTQCLTAIEQAHTTQQLESARVTFLGRQGEIAKLMDALKGMSVEQKKEFGPKLNTLKQNCQAAFDEKQSGIDQKQLLAAAQREQNFDVSAYIPNQLTGTIHPYTQIIEHIENIFNSMGFTITDGPEIETDFYNFTALNIPPDHPARDLHDTFWLAHEKNLLLRTHTSTAQIRAMQTQKPPIALCVNGRVYRHEATDATHDFQFMQTECMVIDKGISMANLLAGTQSILRALFEQSNLEIRVRPGYFPFVEPGIEVDITCPFCQGKGCSTCKRTGWIEAGGAGLIHPNVLKSGGIDPNIYSGWALGFGLTRLVMLKYGIPDIRLLHGNSLNFLKQF